MDVWTPPAKPMARPRDPSTSHEGGEAYRASGALESDQQRVLDALRRHPGVTSDELAARSGIDRYTLARRLPELRDEKRLVEVRGYPETPEKRRSEVSGRKGMVWRPVIREPEQLEIV